MPSEYEAARELEQARQSLRDSKAAGRATQQDAERVKRANRALDEAKAAKKVDAAKAAKAEREKKK